MKGYSADDWIDIFASVGHDYNHMADFDQCPVCIGLAEIHGPIPSVEELGWAEYHRLRRKRTSKYSKVPIPDDLRWLVWERDDFRCAECGRRQFLTVDHIVPESKGGTLDPSNLRTLCRWCNSRKGARHDGGNG